MYLYPDNLTAQATMWFWALRDLVVIGTSALFGVLLLFNAGIFLPFVFTVVYAFLTIQFDGTTIMSFIRCACLYFVFSPQEFHWKEYAA